MRRSNEIGKSDLPARHLFRMFAAYRIGPAVNGAFGKEEKHLTPDQVPTHAR